MHKKNPCVLCAGSWLSSDQLSVRSESKIQKVLKYFSFFNLGEINLWQLGQSLCDRWGGSNSTGTQNWISQNLWMDGWMDSKGRFDIISFLQVRNVWSMVFYFLQNSAFSFSELISVGFINCFHFFIIAFFWVRTKRPHVSLTSSQNIFYSARCSMSSIFLF